MKKVLISGSSRGIGASIASLLHNKGYEVILSATDKAKLISMSEKLGGVKYVVCDLLKDGSIEYLYEQTGPVDILINNAGIYFNASIEESKYKDVCDLFKLNTIVPYMLCAKYIKGMKEKGWGRVVSIGSVSGSIGEAYASAYSASKAALSGLTKSLALEVAQNGITVNLINPGWVDTELGQNSIEQSDFELSEIKDTIPQRRFIEPYEIAHLVKYLVSNEAKGLSGQGISLCAGISIG